MRRSRKAALLQLSMGRLAHTIGIACGLALALTAVIAYGLVNWDFLRDAPAFMVTLKWMIPLVAGASVAAIGLAMKWGPYVADHEEAHFIMSVVALVAPIFIILLIVLDEYDFIVLGRPSWLYSASLLGMSLTEISLAMTWEGTSSRKSIGIAAAVFPILLLLFPIFFKFTDEELASILPMAYLGGAVSIQLSGSMLHIISSSTQVQQREVLKASDSKLREQLADIDKKRQALNYREEALRSKESGLEAYEKHMSDEAAALEERKQTVLASESELEQRQEEFRKEKEMFATQQAATDTRQESLTIKLGEIDALRKELEKRAKSLLSREEAVGGRERESSRLVIDLQAKERDIRNRLAEVEAEEVSLRASRKELATSLEALKAREKDLGRKESELDLKSLQVADSVKKLGAVAAEKTSVKGLEQQLLAKQQQIAEKEIALKAADDEMRQKSEKAERLIARSDKQMNELVEKENALMAREKAIADKESVLRREVEALNSKLEETNSARSQVTDMEKQYQSLTESTKGKMTAITAKEEEISRKMVALEKREEKIKDLDVRLRQEHETMDKKLRQLLEKEKALRAEEEEINLRHAELRAMEREALEPEEEEEVESAEEAERAKVLDFRERKLAEKEQEMKSKLYQKEKELEKREEAIKTSLRKDLEEMEEDVEEEYKEEKIKSGIERLDDLLMGGMPFGSNILYVGPPFIGKEVAMLLFVAEGLRKAVPAIIVTTSKSPNEISKDIAPILPSFKEFEQIGLVRWIDASGMPPEQGTESYANITRISKPGDLAGIVAAVEKNMKELLKQKQPYVRLIYMSLSMSIAQADEKSAFQFVQNLAGKLKVAGAVSIYAVERGMHTEQQLESIQHHMTGSVQFKTDKQKTLLSVQGIGDAQTRDWIEYKHTNKAVMIGAFSLERIR